VDHRAVAILFTLIESCNRSTPHVKLIQTTLGILLNLTNFPRTCTYVYQGPSSVELLVGLMQKYYDKADSVFALATRILIGIIRQKPVLAKEIKSIPTVASRFKSMQHLLERKQIMEKKNDRRLTLTSSVLAKAVPANYVSTNIQLITTLITLLKI